MDVLSTYGRAGRRTDGETRVQSPALGVAAEGCDALVAIGVMPAGVRL
jgi:hypothetical protein